MIPNMYALDQNSCSINFNNMVEYEQENRGGSNLDNAIDVIGYFDRSKQFLYSSSYHSRNLIISYVSLDSEDT